MQALFSWLQEIPVALTKQSTRMNIYMSLSCKGLGIDLHALIYAYTFIYLSRRIDLYVQICIGSLNAMYLTS